MATPKVFTSVDSLEIDDAGLVAHGFDERRKTEITSTAKQTLRREGI